MKGMLPIEGTASLSGLIMNRTANRNQAVSTDSSESNFARYLDHRAANSARESRPSQEQKAAKSAAEDSNQSKNQLAPGETKGVKNADPNSKPVAEKPTEDSLQEELVEAEASAFSAETIELLKAMLLWLQQADAGNEGETQPLTALQLDESALKELLNQAEQQGIELKHLKQVLQQIMNSKASQVTMPALAAEVTEEADVLIKFLNQMEAKAIRPASPTESKAPNQAAVPVTGDANQAELELNLSADPALRKEQRPTETAAESKIPFTLEIQPAAGGVAEIKTPQAASLPTITVDPEMIEAEPQRLIDQLVKNLELVQKSGATEMRIQLKPEFLGKMLVTLTVQEGMLTARFLTESHQVRGVLEANMQALKQSLEANGIRVEKTEVDVQVNTGGAFEREFAGYQGESAWAKASERGGYVRPLPEDDELIEDHYALQMEPNFISPSEAEFIFAAGRMNLVV